MLLSTFLSHAANNSAPGILDIGGDDVLQRVKHGMK